MSRSCIWAAACALAVVIPGRAEAQARPQAGNAFEGVRVVGHVVDGATGRDLPSVTVVLAAGDSTEAQRSVAQSDSVGGFVIEALLPGLYHLMVNAFGYSEVSRPLTLAERGTVELRIEMSPEALDLDPVVVTVARPAWLAEAGFYERRERGMGYTLTRAEIEARNPHRTSDLFYTIPGADVIAGRDGYSQATVLLRGRCVPQVVLDGAPFSAPVAIDNVVSVSELEAVEVYHGSSNATRYSTSSCGTIMLWSRRGGAGGGAVSWKRILTGVVVVAWITLTTLWAGQ